MPVYIFVVNYTFNDVFGFGKPCNKGIALREAGQQTNSISSV